ncbi:MAG: leucine-rich repeat domain-containing protein [Treponema sp.]|nr:leucine-rich repeat domain-containing protein [Treponema sp.]
MLAAFLAAATAYAQPFDSAEEFRWQLSPAGDSVVITGHAGTGGDVRIPPRIQGLPVTEIAPWAFLGNTFTSAAIPNTVATIGAMAFASNQITSVSLGAAVEYIGLMAFAGNQLTAITIPHGVTSIGGGAFRDNLLTAVTIPDTVAFVGDGAFGDAQIFTSAGDVFDPWTVILIEAPEQIPPFADPARFWSVGLAGGLFISETVSDPGLLVAGGTVQATASPLGNWFVRIGGDIFHGRHDSRGEFSSWSFHPFAQAVFFQPAFGWYGGFYLGAGAGFRVTQTYQIPILTNPIYYM